MELKSNNRGSNVCGIRVEKACYIFAIINAVVVSAVFAGCLYYIGWICDVYFHPERHRDIDGFSLYLDEILCLILSVSSGVAFLFAVLLCYGVQKEIPCLLMTYFVYGILVEILSVAGAIAYVVKLVRHFHRYTVQELPIAALALAGCAIYGFALVVVRRTYVAFVNAARNPVNKSLLA